VRNATPVTVPTKFFPNSRSTTINSTLALIAKKPNIDVVVSLELRKKEVAEPKYK
jgi:hypothetical protein